MLGASRRRALGHPVLPFDEVLSLLESHGWSLMPPWGNYRVFSKPGTDVLPILVEVEERMVRATDVERIKRILGEGEE
jgi:hypothetical protein